MYTNVLLAGCRCVELDCVDGYNGEPVVTHKGAAVNRVAITKILQAIKDSAFVVSPYPVVLSLEMHLSNSQQEKLAAYFVEILGEENIYALKDFTTGEAYASPEQLKGKFILKVSPLFTLRAKRMSSSERCMSPRGIKPHPS